MKRVLIAGGKGLIGSACVKKFEAQGCEVKVADLPEFDMAHPLSVLNCWLPCDILVNATYSRDAIVHILDYSALSYVVASEMKDVGCSIVHIASIYGLVAPYFPIYENTEIQETPLWYSAAKGAIIQVTRHLAAKYAPKVRVNCVSPGGVFDNQDPKFVERYVERVPLKRMATPEDVANAVAFLSGDEASYITGQNVVIDGGLTIC